MLFVRPARLADLDELERMARAAQPVLHSLPRERRALEPRVALSEDSFRAEVEFPGEEFYLFVLEESETKRLLGTSSIVASAGYAEPFHAFRNDALIHASRELKVSRKIHALTMSHELTGKSRLTGFYIDPSLRDEDNAAAAHLLSRARMIYIAANPRRFSTEVFSLMLGVTDDAGASPFWDAVGRKFFGRDFEQVEAESGGRSRTFIAEVMPSYPLYVPLLPADAQRVLGEPNEHTLLAYDIHLEEGFEPDRYVDIFDAGPVLTIAVDKSASASSGELRAVRERGADDGAGAPYLVAAGGAHAFRCVIARLSGTRADGAALTAAARAALGVSDGDTVRCVPLHQASGELP
ncbi:arginine/ornithine succinyltransferase subunit alpha [Caballeronia sp. LZ033]|uniref:arginine/ornithine succinyltransferase subunit alpha n=1 Tax=Caballeronia sp. LZ033 TaxID=3038566 RepID=UPI0028588ED3|nr:arginine/ornithine succinyltransferase subunit alpha [Caballeronia sp. LZ033]MDR5813005.1 arginine/ornithine succinyltransferase subunit alpha [Caballeronia sp. LZ033]